VTCGLGVVVGALPAGSVRASNRLSTTWSVSTGAIDMYPPAGQKLRLV
jgi:hypothetical protein